MEDDDIYESASENHSIGEGGNWTAGIQRNGHEPLYNLQGVLDNKIAKTEIIKEDDDIPNSSTESGAKSLKSRLLLNKIVPEHAGRRHKATTDEMPTEKETTKNGWTKLDNVLFKDGILIDDTNFLPSFIQSALIQESGQPNMLNEKSNTVDTGKNVQETFESSEIEMSNIVVMQEKITVVDTFFCNSAIQSGFKNNAETNENSFNKERREFVRKETVKVDNFGNNVQGRFQKPGIKTDIKIMKRCSVSLQMLSCIGKYGREPSQGPNLESDHLVAIKDTVKEEYIGKNGQYHIKDPEVESAIQIVRQCSVSLERLPSIEKYCQVPFEYPVGVLPNMGCQQSGLIQVQTNDMSAEMNDQGLIDSEADKTTTENNDFFINLGVLNNKPIPAYVEMDGLSPLTCIDIDDDDTLSSSDVEFVDSTEVQDKVVSTEKDLHDPNQKIEIAHKNYKCNLCDETFTLESKYQVHLFYHTIVNIKCFKCHKMFDSGVALQNHMKTNHNEKPPQRKTHLSPVESESKGKAWSDEEDFSDEDDQPLSVLAEHNPLKCKVKNKAGSGKQVLTELEFRDIFLTENNGHNLSEYRIKNKKVSVSSTSTDVIFHNLSDKYGNANQQISVLIDTNRNNRSKNKEVTDHLSAGSDEEVCNDTEFHQDVNIDKNVSESENLQQNYMRVGSGDMFTTTEEMKKHEITPKKYECDLCENVFNQYSKYQQHLVYHTNGDKLKCLYCRKRFDSGLALKCHIQKRNCKQCRICFSRSDALKKHMQFIHSGIHPYKCTKCDEGFLLADELDKHSLSHIYKKLHTCEVCYKSFHCKVRLSDHIQTHIDTVYKCTKCSKTFVSQRNLDKHLFLHSGVKKYKCKICSKAFAESWVLRKHLIKHTGIQPHKCPICDKRFSHIKRVKRHLVIIHYGKKEHKCIHCNECFALFPDLKRHYEIHNDLRPYKCKECPKSFVLPHQLGTHMLSHSGVKPHQCVQCGSSFRLPHHLRNHLLIHSGKKRPKRK